MAAALVVLLPLIATGVGVWVLGAALGFGRWTHTRAWNTPDAAMAGLALQAIALPLTATLARSCIMLVRWALGLRPGHLVPWWLAAASAGAVSLAFFIAAAFSPRPDLPVVAMVLIGLCIAGLGWIATHALAAHQGAWPLFKRD